MQTTKQLSLRKATHLKMCFGVGYKNRQREQIEGCSKAEASVHPAKSFYQPFFFFLTSAQFSLKVKTNQRDFWAAKSLKIRPCIEIQREFASAKSSKLWVMLKIQVWSSAHKSLETEKCSPVVLLLMMQ